MENFESMGLPEPLMHALQKMEFTTPTPIQSKAIPIALEGKDILGSAQTGTGKTGAFGIPLIAHLLNFPGSCALVMTPTRELAKQVTTQLELMLGKRSNVRAALLIGGDPMFKQIRQLKGRPRLVVGTPGRINDHLKRGTLRLSATDFLVLDETDRMLDMGFTIQIEDVLKHMGPKRQTLLFSATLPPNIVSIAERYLTDPVRVAVSHSHKPAENIKQEMVQLKESEKYDALVSQLEEREGAIIVFMKTKMGADRMATRLHKAGHSVAAIHGDLRQNKRERVIAAYRKEKYKILVATDVAARGLDIPHVEHVINYDLPQCPEDYIHRIGRTARAGAKGNALNFLTPADRFKWKAIDRLMNPGKEDKSFNPRKKPEGKPGKRRFNPKAKRDRFSFIKKKKSFKPRAKKAA